MASRQTIETVYRSFRDILDVAEPFGGKVTIFGGDFHQVLPVIPKSTKAEIVNASNGEEPTTRDDLVLLPKQLVIENKSSSTTEVGLVDQILPSLDKNASCAKYMTERAILASKNEYVDQLNKMLISRFPGESITFLSFDSVEDDTNNYYQEEYLNTLTPSGLPPHRYALDY
ncbi:hypothetical protein P3S67_014586 [Capsicum chacoense]